jgi:hypothetical protein
VWVIKIAFENFWNIIEQIQGVFEGARCLVTEKTRRRCRLETKMRKEQNVQTTQKEEYEHSPKDICVEFLEHTLCRDDWIRTSDLAPPRRAL